MFATKNPYYNIELFYFTYHDNDTFLFTETLNVVHTINQCSPTFYEHDLKMCHLTFHYP